MTLLRLAPLSGTGIDAAVATVSTVTLTRRGNIAYAEVASGEAPRFVRELALAGISARSHDGDLPTGERLVPSVGTDLSPCASADVDRVHIRRLELGEATGEVARRRWAWIRPMSAAARDRCRSLLRGEDALLAWRRTAWAEREMYRSATVRRSLRPLVFDRSAAEHGPEGRVFAREGAITHWLFG